MIRKAPGDRRRLLKVAALSAAGGAAFAGLFFVVARVFEAGTPPRTPPPGSSDRSQKPGEAHDRAIREAFDWFESSVDWEDLQPPEIPQNPGWPFPAVDPPADLGSPPSSPLRWDDF